jgi:hypothetical protein
MLSEHVNSIRRLGIGPVVDEPDSYAGKLFGSIAGGVSHGERLSRAEPPLDQMSQLFRQHTSP